MLKLKESKGKPANKSADQIGKSPGQVADVKAKRQGIIIECKTIDEKPWKEKPA